MAVMGGSCVSDACDLAAGAVRSLLQRTAPPTSLQGWKAYVTIVVLVIGLVLLYMDLWRIELVMIGMVVTLLWAQVRWAGSMPQRMPAVPVSGLRASGTGEAPARLVSRAEDPTAATAEG